MEQNYLIHYGIKGMKWGVRRYQNKDGSLTNAGKKRQAQRDKDVKKYNDQAADFKKRATKAKAELKELESKGFKSKLYKYAYGPEGESDELLSMAGYGSRKEALSLLKSEQRNLVKAYEKESRNRSRMSDKIKATPIGQETFADVNRRRDTIATGAARATALLGIAGSTALTVYTKNPRWVIFGSLGSLYVSAVTGGSIKRNDTEAYNRMYEDKLEK